MGPIIYFLTRKKTTQQHKAINLVIKLRSSIRATAIIYNITPTRNQENFNMEIKQNHFFLLYPLPKGTNRGLRLHKLKIRASITPPFVLVQIFFLQTKFQENMASSFA